eukprot:1474657-Amphidinium_carterae.1
MATQCTLGHTRMKLKLWSLWHKAFCQQHQAAIADSLLRELALCSHVNDWLFCLTHAFGPSQTRVVWASDFVLTCTSGLHEKSCTSLKLPH